MPYAPEHDEVPNPLRPGLRAESAPEPCAVAVFGASGNRLYYFATPPSTFPTLLKQLKDAGLINNVLDPRYTRVVIEKPFGRDLPSARALNRYVLEVCDEKQVFRIDHYLGKETVQNLL